MGSLATRAFSERDLAHGVTTWMVSNFGPQLTDVVRSTPFTVPLLCAIACREAGMYWLPLTPHQSAAQILGLCGRHSGEGIGHVVLISAGKTLESHGGAVPTRGCGTAAAGRRRHSCMCWRARRPSSPPTAPRAAAVRRPRADVHGSSRQALPGDVGARPVQQFAGNDVVASRLEQVGFKDVVVTGGGATRQAEGRWTGPDTTAHLDPHITSVVELPA